MALSSEVPNEGFDAALRALGGLINQRKRADGSNWGDAFNLMHEYVKILGLEEVSRSTNIIHVAGTKGKGSTCAFAESILRSSGFSTGLFTSPHLVDVRERFRINGDLVPIPVFLEHFWWCYNKCKEATEKHSSLPMPAYFRFLTLLSLRIFSQLKVDVILLEVGIGGRYDATNIVTNPAVCGVSTLGYDHMELLGDTLALIAGEKAGIFKPGVPAITSPQEPEAMEVLKKRAEELQILLTVLKPGESIPQNLKLGLAGSHQRINASLAVALATKWADRTGKTFLVETVKEALTSGSLPEAFTRGLQAATWPGRCQIIRDQLVAESSHAGSLSFYLDGAHTPESMEVCAEWFCDAITEEQRSNSANVTDKSISASSVNKCSLPEPSPCTKVLLFNCMPERDPEVLFIHMINIFQRRGVDIDFALFAPSLSSYTSLVPSSKSGSHPPLSAPGSEVSPIDLSWQLKLQLQWDRLHEKSFRSQNGGTSSRLSESILGSMHQTIRDSQNAVSLTKASGVMKSLPSAIGLLRKSAVAGPAKHIKVLVTGSLHLVGDVLRLIK